MMINLSKCLFMKKFFTFIFCIGTIGLHAQTWSASEQITFDPRDTFYHSLVIIDTIHYHHNIWQIGKPNKTVFTSAISLPNAIVTDTTHPYPVNDTSVFVLKAPSKAYCPIYSGNSPLVLFQFSYQLNIDTNAVARLEISVDSGARWVNVKDSLPLHYSWYSTPVDLTVSTNGWNVFAILKCFYCPDSIDTVLFRFTFISDSVSTNKDGWIIDNIDIGYYCEGGIPQIQNNNLINIYPNPSKGNLYIHSNQQNSAPGSVIVYNMQGQEVYKADKLPANGYLNLQLPDGIYTLKYLTDEEYCVKRIVIAK